MTKLLEQAGAIYQFDFSQDHDLIEVSSLSYGELECIVWFEFAGRKQRLVGVTMMFTVGGCPDGVRQAAWEHLLDQIEDELGDLNPDMMPATGWTLPDLEVELMRLDDGDIILNVSFEGGDHG